MCERYSEVTDSGIETFNVFDKVRERAYDKRDRIYEIQHLVSRTIRAMSRDSPYDVYRS